MSRGETFSGALARLVCETGPEALSAEVLTALRDATLDCVASMLAGVREPLFAKLSDHIARTMHSDDCTIIGTNRRATVPGAAFVNGVMAHACDYDDSSWTMWGHPSAPLLPAVIAVTEVADLPGRDALVAYLAGIEVEKCLGQATQPAHYSRGWHPTATIGVFGASAGAGKALGLDRAQLQAAFGIAASMTAGLRANSGTETKPLHVGLAARNGVEAALLAKAGVSASPDALDGSLGFFDLYADAATERAKKALENFGRPFEVVEPGLSPKLYPCCSDTHCAIDGILDMQAEFGFTPAELREIRCAVAPVAEPNVRRRDPRTPTEAKFSLNYCLAVALVHGGVRLRHFESAALRDTNVRGLMERIHVTTDPALAEPGKEVFSSPAIIQAELRSGARLRSVVHEMRGHPNRPLERAELVGKFHECAEGVLPRSKSMDLLAALDRIEELPSMRDLTRLSVP